MLYIKEFVRDNKLGILVAVIVGLIMLLPQLELVFSLGDSYQGIPINEIDNDEFYNSRARDVYDENFSVKSPRVYEPEVKYATIPAFGEAIVAGIAKITDLSVGSVPIVNNFLLPFLLYLILYALFNKITGSKLVSILSAAGVILATNIAAAPHEVIEIFTDFSKLTPSVYNRPVIPQVSSLIFFTFVLLFYSFLKENKKSLLIASGIAYGLLFYTYLFAWTFASVFLGINLLLALVRKEYTQAKKILGIIFIGLAASVFFWINYFRVSALPIYEDMKKNFGFTSSRTPIWSDLLFLDAIFLTIMVWLKRVWDKNVQFVTLFILTVFILINQQVITNFRFFPGHWHWYFGIPISIFIFIWFTWTLIKKINRTYLKPVFGIVVLGILFANGILSQHAYFLKNKEEYTDFQRFAAVFDWIEENTSEDAVVLVNRDEPNRDLFEKITVFTHTYSYLPDKTDRQYLIPQEYFKHTYFVSLYLEHARNPDIDVKKEDFRLMTVLFGFYNWYQFGCRTSCYTDEEILGLRQDYTAFLQHDFKDQIKKYKIDYALWDTRRDQVWNLDEYDFFEPLKEINDIKIYSVI